MAEQENIRNLLPRRPIIFKKEKRHVSIHHQRVREERRKHQDHHATLGVVTYCVTTPAQYLRRGHSSLTQHTVKVNNLARAAEVQKHECERRPRLPVPVKYPPEARHNRRGKDWVRTNVGWVRGLSPPRPPARVVDTKEGVVYDLLSSGRHPNYVFKKTFGRVPTYLLRRKEQLEQEQQQQEAPGDSSSSSRKKKIDSNNEKEDFKLLTEAEKKDLLQGLSHNLRETQRALQSLPVMCETKASIRRRDELQDTVSDLARYIFLLHNYSVAISA
ncbi:enkurin [Procambarus clarkii]|uniref:enkurin n=1 Tax=Procambarus clarkii TaxID=6728 RepID=UPI001E679057|nr:uncharacterized protein LOC123770601 [Procambarus clarkii]